MRACAHRQGELHIAVTLKCFGILDIQGCGKVPGRTAQKGSNAGRPHLAVAHVS